MAGIIEVEEIKYGSISRCLADVIFLLVGLRKFTGFIFEDFGSSVMNLKRLDTVAFINSYRHCYSCDTKWQVGLWRRCGTSLKRFIFIP